MTVLLRYKLPDATGQGVYGGIVNNPPFQETFHQPSSGLLGTIVAIYEIGAFAGALVCAVVGEALGRRKCVFIGASLLLAGAGYQAGVSSSGALIGARIVAGFVMG